MKNLETWPQRMLRKIELDGKTTRQILDQIDKAVIEMEHDEDQVNDLVAELDRLNVRQYRLVISDAPMHTLYRISEELYVLENALIAILAFWTGAEDANGGAS